MKMTRGFKFWRLLPFLGTSYLKSMTCSWYRKTRFLWLQPDLSTDACAFGRQRKQEVQRVLFKTFTCILRLWWIWNTAETHADPGIGGRQCTQHLSVKSSSGHKSKRRWIHKGFDTFSSVICKRSRNCPAHILKVMLHFFGLQKQSSSRTLCSPHHLPPTAPSPQREAPSGSHSLPFRGV